MNWRLNQQIWISKADSLAPILTFKKQYIQDFAVLVILMHSSFRTSELKASKLLGLTITPVFSCTLRNKPVARKHTNLTWRSVSYTWLCCFLVDWPRVGHWPSIKPSSPVPLDYREVRMTYMQALYFLP